MLRPAPLLLGALLLAACASPRPGSSSDGQREPDRTPAEPTRTKERDVPERPAEPVSDGARYLRGVEQPRVRPLTTIASSEQLASDSVMQHAMISGIGEVYVAMAAFAQGEHVGLDLIVVNHRDKAIQLHRKDLKLFDASGRPLTAVKDFPGAAQLGLRGTGQVDPPSFLYETPDAFSLDQDLSMQQPNGSGKSGRGQATRPNRARGSSASDWRAMTPGGHEVQAPATLHVASESGGAWWAYWQADGLIAYPITAFVVFGEEQLMFQFEASSTPVAR